MPTQNNSYFDPILSDLVPGYIESQKKTLQTLARALENQDYPCVAEISHRIKGSAACYGFETYGSLALRLEETSRLEHFEKCRDLIHLMEDELKISP
jgi:HPt (histidine-containing phosphotransfer) domain-containing protein